MAEPQRQLVMDERAVERALARMAREIVERNQGVNGLALVGIQRRGVELAGRLADEIARAEGQRPPVGSLDITLYRDDVARQAAKPLVRRTEINFSIDARKILLVDDVLFTGRTTRAALDALTDFGRPSSIQLVVLVDRGHRELPIRADYVGKNIPTSLSDSVNVRLTEIDDRDEVELQSGGAA